MSIHGRLRASRVRQLHAQFLQKAKDHRLFHVAIRSDNEDYCRALFLSWEGAEFEGAIRRGAYSDFSDPEALDQSVPVEARPPSRVHEIVWGALLTESKPPFSYWSMTGPNWTGVHRLHIESAEWAGRCVWSWGGW